MNFSHRNSLRSNTVGVVEIHNLRRSFYTAKGGAPDMLFPWLLANARAAYQVTLPPSPDAELAAAPPGHIAGIYMAGLMLCDEKFIPAAVPKTNDHHYVLDFLHGTIKMRTQLYTAVGHSAALFNVRIEGQIPGSTFVARNDVTGRVLTSISEDELRKPLFFAEELPFLCFQSHIDPDLTHRANEFLDHSIELRLSLNIDGKNYVVQLIKEAGETKCRVVDSDTGNTLSSIQINSFKNLDALVEMLPTLLMAQRKSGIS
jgi:hypothetical protein